MLKYIVVYQKLDVFLCSFLLYVVLISSTKYRARAQKFNLKKMCCFIIQCLLTIRIFSEPRLTRHIEWTMY